MYKNAIVLMIMAAVCFGRIQTITDTMRTKAIKLTNSGFDSVLTVDVNDSTLKNTGIYYNRVSQYTYFPTGIVIDTLNSEAAITVRSPNSTEYPSIPLKLYPASTNENVGHVIINPMLKDTFYNGSWLNKISTGGVSIGGQLYGETRKSEMIVGPEGFYFINRFYHADENNDACIHIDNSHNLYITDTTGVNLGLNLAVGGVPNPTRGISLGENGSHIYDSLFLHGIKEDLTSDTVDILFMSKYGYGVKKRSLADFADTIIKIIEATDTVYVDSARAAWKADTLIYLSDSLDVVRSLISAASDSVEKSHHSVYSDTADTAFVAGVADSAKNVSDTVAAHINGTLRYVAAFTDATHLGNSTMHFTSPSMGVLDFSSGSIQAMSIGLTATCAADSLYGSKSCFYFSPKLRHPDTVSSFDMVPVVDDSVVKVTSSSTFRTQIGAQAAISGTDNYVAKYNGTGALQNSIIYDDDSKVGIGTDAPSDKLHIVKGSSGAKAAIANIGLTVENNSTTAINILSPDANLGIIYFGSPSNNNNASILTNYNSGSPYLALRTNGINERMRIVSDGKVGIGTTTPAAKLQIAEIPTSTFGILVGNDITDGGMTDNTRKYLRIGCPSYDIDEAPVSIITVDNNGTNNILYIGGGTGVGNAATTIKLRTAALNTTIGTDRVTILSDGKVGIGTETPAEELHVNGTIRSDDLTASMVVVTDASKNLVSSDVTATGLGFVNNTLVTSQTLTDGSATNLFEVSIVGDGDAAGGIFSYTIKATFSNLVEVLTGEVIFNARGTNGDITGSIKEVDEISSGSMTSTFAITPGSSKVTISCNANSSLAIPTITIFYKLEMHIGNFTEL